MHHDRYQDFSGEEIDQIYYDRESAWKQANPQGLTLRDGRVVRSLSQWTTLAIMAAISSFSGTRSSQRRSARQGSSSSETRCLDFDRTFDQSQEGTTHERTGHG